MYSFDGRQIVTEHLKLCASAIATQELGSCYVMQPQLASNAIVCHQSGRLNSFVRNRWVALERNLLATYKGRRATNIG